jgi:tRNA A-37 threonylcarbamoyl transferase component Bud32
MPSPSNQHEHPGRQIPQDTAQADSDAVWIDMHRRWRAGDRVPVEAYLSGPQAVRGDSQIVDLIYGEYCLREQLGERPSAQEYVDRFPRFATEIRRQIAVHRAIADTSVVHSASETPHGESPDEAPMPPAIGKYRLVQKLGAGGQAWVYRAVHPTLARDVVIKLSRRTIEDHSSGLDRLLDEGRALAELDHPHLARVYDLDVYERRIYLVMEYIPGKNLEQYATDSPVSIPQAVAIVLKTAQAVAAAHRRGVTHCDIKPRNIVIDEQGQPRLLDFGLSRWENAWRRGGDPGQGITGTPQFLAPEQTRGDPAAIGPRTDVFALGGLLYYLLSGHPPFPGHDLETVLRAAAQCDFDRNILDERGVPQRVKAVCLRAMSLRPEDRYQSADELARDLERLVERPRRWWAMASASSLLALALGIGVWACVRAFLPAPSPQAGGTSTASAPVPAARPTLAVQVLRRGRFVDIADAAPLASGDKLRARLAMPAGSFVSLFLINGQGQLFDLLVPSSRSGAQEITYPKSPGQVVTLSGPAGTDVLLACAARDRPVKREALLPFLDPQTPWAKLPALAVLKLENDQVSAAETSRDFGPPLDATDPEAEVRARLEGLGKRLGKQLAGCETRLGIAFSHADAPLERGRERN